MTPPSRTTRVARYRIVGPNADVEYEVVSESGEFCASSTSLPDAQHYAAVYGQDGPVEIIEVIRAPLRAPKGDGR